MVQDLERAQGYDGTDLARTVSSGPRLARAWTIRPGLRQTANRWTWTRSTVCFRKSDGDWKVMHTRGSVPFYMDGSFRAPVDLKPEVQSA